MRTLFGLIHDIVKSVKMEPLYNGKMYDSGEENTVQLQHTMYPL